MTLTPERMASLREKALAAESFTAGKPWSYDEEAADVHNGIRERGKHILDYGASFVVCDPAMKDDNLDRVAAFGRHIAAADPQTVLALVEEVERLRAKNAAYHDRLHHPCEGCPGCSSSDCPDALHIAQIDLAEVRDEILRLRESNAKVTDARDNLLDEVGRLRSMEATLRAIVRDLNIARGDAGSEIGLGGAYCGVVRLIGENEALRKAMDERESDMHSRIRAGYDKTVADSWRAANEKLQARVAELEAVMSQRMGVYAAPRDERQVGS